MSFSGVQSLQAGWNKVMKKVDNNNEDLQKLNSSMSSVPDAVKDI
jgi:hypothetical protein